MMELLVFNDIGPQTAGPVVSPLTEVLLTAQRWSVSRLAGQAGFYRGEEISEITENWSSVVVGLSQGWALS